MSNYTASGKLVMVRSRTSIALALVKMYQHSPKRPVGYLSLAEFRQRRTILMFHDHTLKHELIRIQGHDLIGYAEAYDIIDSVNGSSMFTLRHQKVRSQLRDDAWQFYDSGGRLFGDMTEISGQLARFRYWAAFVPIIGRYIRLGLWFIPKEYSIRYRSSDAKSPCVCQILVYKSPLKMRVLVDSSMAPADFDQRVAIASAGLLCGHEIEK